MTAALLTFLIAAACALTTVAVVFVRPWRLAIALEARGQADGGWALAGGAELCGCSASLAAARGAPLVTDLRILGRPVRRRRRPASLPTKEPVTLESLQRSYARLERWVDPFELSTFLISEVGRVSIRDVDGSVTVGLRDVALAGEIAGVLAMASALAAPFGKLRHDIDWSGDEHAEASLSLALRFSPALLVADAVRFALRSIHLRRRAPDARRLSPRSS